jgi:diphosphoinositol-polyphosphate diphosphatase
MQGGWENDETVEEAAAREAIEEAGVRGDLVVRHCFYVLFGTTLVD